MDKFWLNKLSDIGISDMPIFKVVFQPKNLDENWYPLYKKERRLFLQSLTDSIEELANLNLERNDILNIINGKLPENLSIRFRVPIMYGGDISKDNMFLLPTNPFNLIIDRFFLIQANDFMKKMSREIKSGYDFASTLFVPYPLKKVYCPTTGNIAIGDGGNATEDRLAQVAATMLNQQGKI